MSVPVDIRQIINCATECEMHVTGPTAKNGESVYRINEHALTEAEMRNLATENLLTTWGIYNYVKVRDQNRKR